MEKAQRTRFWLRLLSFGILSYARPLEMARRDVRDRESDLQKYDALISEANVLDAENARTVNFEGVRASNHAFAGIPVIGGAAYGPDWDMLRQEILDRDSYTCQEESASCNGPLQIHHRVPLSQGGVNGPANLVTLCYYHHSRKHAHMRVQSRGNLRS